MPLILENEIGWAWQKNKLIVSMRYIGGTLSVNRYRTKQGIIRREVQDWMRDLKMAVQLAYRDMEKPKPPVHICIDGFFKDERIPDLANLHKVIGDALQIGLGINDKKFRFQDGKGETGYDEPYLRIGIEGEK